MTNWLTENLPTPEEACRDPEKRRILQERIRDSIHTVIHHCLPGYETIITVNILEKSEPLVLDRDASAFIMINGPKEGIQAIKWEKKSDEFEEYNEEES